MRQHSWTAWGWGEEDNQKNEVVEVEDEDTGVVGDGEGMKVWKVK